MALKIFAKAMKIVQKVHQYGVIHRDLKLDNFLISRSDGAPVLIDFGFAVSTEVADKDGYLKNDMSGTLNYLAPEILLKFDYNGVHADVFAMGVVLFQLVFKRDPFVKASNSDGRYY